MTASDHETVVELGMTKHEIIRVLEREAPEHGRLTDFSGDVDLVLVWRVRERRPAAVPDITERLARAEDDAWQAWIEADSRARSTAEAERQAFADVCAARETWRQAIRDLAQVATQRPPRQTVPADTPTHGAGDPAHRAAADPPASGTPESVPVANPSEPTRA